MNKPQQIHIETYDAEENKIQVDFILSKKGRTPEITQFDLGKNATLTCYYENEEEEKYVSADIKEFYNCLQNDGAIKISGKTCKLPKIRYADITEKNLIGSDELLMGNLKSEEYGLWSNIGKRLFEIHFLFDSIDSKNSDCFTEDSVIQYVNFTKVNGEKCERRDFKFEYKSVELKQADTYDKDGKKVVQTDRHAVVTIDTDTLAEVFSEEKYKEKNYLTLSGAIGVSSSDSEDDSRIEYKFPIELILVNTEPEKCIRKSRKPASIDFGTSSTCVAIEGKTGKELLTLSNPSEEDGGNVFENPTNFMMFNWNTIYDEWKDIQSKMPMFYKGTKQDYNVSERKSDKEHGIDYDFGYSVKTLLGDDEISNKELKSIVTDIKMIPYQLAQNKQMTIKPYNDKNKFININNVEKQDDSNLDPVAFYGYLIGRAINDISKRSEIYTKFYVTTPVMFNKDIKEKLKKSLKYGLQRTVPKTLQNEVKVILKYTEPVAFIAAMCGSDYFKVDENKEEMFAVYDFGGGTLDFSFGTVKNSEDGSTTIKVHKVGGKGNIGGERIIERLAYKIYAKNAEQMETDEIPIKLPDDEKRQEDVPDYLIQSSDSARINLSILGNKIARLCFEGKMDDETEVNTIKNNPITLYDVEGESKEGITLSWDKDDLEVYIEEIVKDTVEIFKREMEEAFKDKEQYDENNVYIFKAGNSSKSNCVKEAMQEAFPNNEHIQMVDEANAQDATNEPEKPTEQEEDNEPEKPTEQKGEKTGDVGNTVSNLRYAITPKTAVAIGQLKLITSGSIAVEGDSDLFKYYVGYFNEGTGEFKICLNKDTKKGEWHKLHKVYNDDNDIGIFFATTKPRREDRDKTKHVEIPANGHSNENVFLRIEGTDEVTIQYCFSKDDEVKDDEIKTKKLVLE